MDSIAAVREHLLKLVEQTDDPRSVLRAPELRDLYAQIKQQPEDQRAAFGQAVNELKQELEDRVGQLPTSNYQLPDIDVTAPMDVNAEPPELLPTEDGTVHPVSAELEKVIDIFQRMGFVPVESRQIDDEHHMFTSLNFPEDHPARDDYDTFITEEGFIAPAHVSTMQHRVIKNGAKNLEAGEPISNVYFGRTFRNEDVDARHEHTFNQVELMYVDKVVDVGNLISTLKTFLQTYYEQDLNIRVTPFYFPFTEPSFEFALSCPFCKQKGCKVCSYEGWIELLGCGLVNPNVLEMGGVDASKYTGFAAGLGLERLVMMKYDIEDIRHFNSGKLAFLRQFK